MSRLNDHFDWETYWDKQKKARDRFVEIMRRHVCAEDFDKSDDEIVRSVMQRYEGARSQPLIDPSE